MNLFDWLNEQKLPLLGEELKKNSTSIRIEKVNDLKKLFATLSAAEVLKILNIAMNFETLAEGVHLLDALRTVDNDELKQKNYPPWIEYDEGKFPTKFKPNFESELKHTFANVKETTMTEIVTKWNMATEKMTIVSHSTRPSRIDRKSDQKHIFLSLKIDKNEKDNLKDLLEFIRLEFDTRMIPMPHVFLSFGHGDVELM